jgi:hypothetical protein
MYRSCIFCSAPLGSNESIERFPVGRSLAFDGEKGRLWAVCPKCARWNLAPIEERWEAIEDAERLFHDTRTRVQRENVGLARLPNETWLVRVGQALPGELAAWRYGQTLVRRRNPYSLAGRMVLAGVAGLAEATMAVAAGVLALANGPYTPSPREPAPGQGPVRFVPRPAKTDAIPVIVRRHDLIGARLREPEGGGMAIHFVNVREVWNVPRVAGDDTPYARVSSAPLVVAGEAARALLTRAMVLVNDRGARRGGVEAALRRISAAGSAEDFMRNAARNGRPLIPENPDFIERWGDLALEMALHEETERRALDGELAMLEAMWHEAEQIASIADRLPELPVPEPPRLSAES